MILKLILVKLLTLHVSEHYFPFCMTSLANSMPFNLYALACLQITVTYTCTCV